MSDLRKLIEAVEAGAWGDAKTQNFGELGHLGLDAARAYNGSLDAAKALHDALLPGWGWELNILSARVAHPDHGVFFGQRVSDLQARLWLIAILKAYEAQR